MVPKGSYMGDFGCISVRQSYGTRSRSIFPGGSMAQQRMLSFVSVEQQTPDKREAAERLGDFHEITPTISRRRLTSRRRAARNAASPSVRPIVLSETTSRTGLC